MTTANVSVNLHSIGTEGYFESMSVDLSSALSMHPAVGDLVSAIPQAALPTNSKLLNADVTGTDTVNVTFGADGGTVTGAATNFKFVVTDLM